MNRLMSALGAGVDRMNRASRHCMAFAVLAVAAQAASASTLNFDGLADGTSVTTQFSGVTFSNATVLTAGGSLNELDFPPRSGSNVVVDFGGPIELVFGADQSFFEAYFTYMAVLTVTGYDAGGVALLAATSSFGSNLATSGEPGSAPNERIALSTDGLRRVVIQGSGAGASFVMDDVTFRPAETAPIPEPSTYALLIAGLGLLGFMSRRRAQ